MTEPGAGGVLTWMDLEFSGLDPKKDVILEIASIITDDNLNIIAEGPAIAIHQPNNILYGMDEWNKTHHNESGLIDRVLASEETHESAQAKTLEFVSKHVKAGESPLCGNSIHQDRWFMKEHMPRLEAHFHYRNVDVSSVKELVRRWYPGLPQKKKQERHRALDDIRESIEELRYYRENVFKA